VEKLAESIIYYLDHEQERLRIVENAYHFATKEMTFGNSIRIIMEAVRKARESMP
jgi:spore maturation protein CgeB